MCAAARARQARGRGPMRDPEVTQVEAMIFSLTFDMTSRDPDQMIRSIYLPSLS